MKKYQKTKQSGFTLIELLVVISIIGVLSSIVLVALQKAKQGALNAVAVATTRQIQNQLAIYQLENDGYPNPYGPDAHWYCIGPQPICVSPNSLDASLPYVNPLDLGRFSLLSPGPINPNSLWTLFETKKAEASTNSDLARFNSASLSYPIYYWCAGSISPSRPTLCAPNNAWLLSPTFSGNTVIYKTSAVGDTGSTVPGFSSY